MNDIPVCFFLNKFKKYVENFLIFKKDPLSKMLKNVLKNNVDFKRNNEASLFSNLMIDKIKSKII